MATATYTMDALAAASGVSARTLRQWIKQKVLHRPHGQGRAARYDEQHVLKARAVQQLRLGKLSLPSIRARLGGIDDEQLRALAPAVPRALTAEGVPLPPAPPTYPRTQWDVVTLMDGLILLVDARRGPLLQRIADDIYRHYGVTQSGAG